MARLSLRHTETELHYVVNIIFYIVVKTFLAFLFLKTRISVFLKFLNVFKNFFSQLMFMQYHFTLITLSTNLQ